MTTQSTIIIALVAVLILVAEGFFAYFVTKLFKVISVILVALMVFQLLAAVYIVTAPGSGPASDLGGANLGPSVVSFFVFWGSLLVWFCCILTALVLEIGSRRRKR
jgi:hypothetical protein